MEPLLAARFAHVRPQYGWTLVPSLNFGLLLQFYEIRIRQRLRGGLSFDQGLPRIRRARDLRSDLGRRQLPAWRILLSSGRSIVP